MLPVVLMAVGPKCSNSAMTLAICHGVFNSFALTGPPEVPLIPILNGETWQMNNMAVGVAPII